MSRKVKGTLLRPNLLSVGGCCACQGATGGSPPIYVRRRNSSRCGRRPYLCEIRAMAGLALSDWRSHPPHAVGLQYSRWGLIEGRSLESVIKKLREAQRFEEVYLSFFGRDT